MDENQPLSQLATTPINQVVRQWHVSAPDNGRRLDTFLITHLPNITRRDITAWIAAGHARVNDRVRVKGSVLHAGDTVTLSFSLDLLPNPDLPIEIVWADDAIVVVNKPSGIATVALRHDEIATVANFLRAHFPDTTAASPRALEAGVVHRLDTATSGLLLVARTPEAYTALREQFSHHTVEKRYLAVVHGRIHRSGERRSLLQASGVRGQRMKETTESGQEAQTTYVPITHFAHHTLIQVTILTGVRHQIRVHLSALGHPIVGDALYGPSIDDGRLCLHAESLAFTHPETGARVQFTCPPSEDFQSVLQQARKEKE
ncbi:MAG: RluA family pseudouridine synthase [Deltaproteobacteria bacterium]|nr:RluA family pseudouridine synthase [Deltaproteobacteria bacterium]